MRVQNVSCFALYCCALKTAILLSSELSLTKGRHFEMFLATFDISIFTHWYESLWLNLNIVLFRNIRWDLWDKEPWNLTIKPLSHAWIRTGLTLCYAQNRMRSAILGNHLKAPKCYLSLGGDRVWSSSFLSCIAVVCRFLYQANLACVNEIHQNVNDLVFTDKVE